MRCNPKEAKIHCVMYLSGISNISRVLLVSEEVTKENECIRGGLPGLYVYDLRIRGLFNLPDKAILKTEIRLKLLKRFINCWNNFFMNVLNSCP